MECDILTFEVESLSRLLYDNKIWKPFNKMFYEKRGNRYNILKEKLKVCQWSAG